MRSNTTFRRWAAAALLVSAFSLVSGKVRGQGTGAASMPAGATSFASMPTPTGMLYYGGTLEMQSDGHWGLADYPIVTRVDSGSVAAQGGFRIGDVLLLVNGRDARKARPFRLQGGEERWVVRIRRGTEEKELTMEVPPSMQSGQPGQNAALTRGS